MRVAAPLSRLAPSARLAVALSQIADGSSERDRAGVAGGFPEDAFSALEDCGLAGLNAGQEPHRRPPAAEELGAVRAVARADGSLGRIYDGHLNAIERLAVQAPPELAAAELPRFAAGELRAGVWGGDPIPGEGRPAAVCAAGPARPVVLRGVKTFCSGAGGLDRALVLARPLESGPPVCVWVDLRSGSHVEIDTGWYQSSGLRASVSHRVIFHDAPVLAQFGAPGAISQDPWFSRDALRTAASWAGMADTAVSGALDELARRPNRGELEGLAAARIQTAQRSIDLWLERAAVEMDAATLALPASGESHADPPQGDSLRTFALQARVSIASACGVIIDEAAQACGSRPFAHGSELDRACRDLRLFLLQHRLNPMLARAGCAALDARAAADDRRRRP